MFNNFMYNNIGIFFYETYYFYKNVIYDLILIKTREDKEKIMLEGKGEEEEKKY